VPSVKKINKKNGFHNYQIDADESSRGLRHGDIQGALETRSEVEKINWQQSADQR
jgi:hypothetical protein